MDRYRNLKIGIWVLSAIVVIQWIFIIAITRPKKAPKIPLVVKGKIGIVIDDWGYNLNNLSIAEQIKHPLTIAILPKLPFSQTIADKLHGHGFEIILHLPMEPKEKIRLEKNTITTFMDEGTIRNILGQDLTDIKHASGISNHMGSRATQDTKTMEIIFKELKKRRLYFLDSLVSADSVCFDLAHKMHLGFAKRDIFLDNIESAEYIKGQIYKLKTRATVFGQAIGIGHDKKVTLEVLKEIMPSIEKEGYKFVFISELVK